MGRDSEIDFVTVKSTVAHGLEPTDLLSTFQNVVSKVFVGSTLNTIVKEAKRRF